MCFGQGNFVVSSSCENRICQQGGINQGAGIENQPLRSKFGRSRFFNYPVHGFGPADAGNYFVDVTNSVGSATSSVATLTVTPPPSSHFDSATLLPDGRCRLLISGETNFTYAFEFIDNAATNFPFVSIAPAEISFSHLRKNSSTSKSLENASGNSSQSPR